MRSCGECSLCCKLALVEELDKPSNTWCQHCSPGHGCLIYDKRPPVCEKFRCFWLEHEDMPEEMRPDRVGLYVMGKSGDDLLRVAVDPDGANPFGQEVLDRLTAGGHHLIVSSGHRVAFVPSPLREMPKKIMLEWVL